MGDWQNEQARFLALYGKYQSDVNPISSDLNLMVLNLKTTN